MALQLQEKKFQGRPKEAGACRFAVATSVVFVGLAAAAGVSAV